MARTNKDKTTKIDESILDQDPPNINEPQKDEEAEKLDEEEAKKTPEKTDESTEEGETDDTQVDDTEGEKGSDTEKTDKNPVDEESTETQEQKDKRYKAQQTEAQIQAARNRVLIDKVTEADALPEPTEEELRQFVAAKGADWDNLTPFEQGMAKDTYMANKRFSVVNEAVKTTKQIDEWASQVDTFIDGTSGKPEYVKLSGHEAEFRSYAMKEAHRGAPVDILLGSFLYNLPVTPKKKGSVFLNGGGGEASESKPGKVTDIDQITQLRTEKPREYARLVKQGKIDVEL